MNIDVRYHLLKISITLVCFSLICLNLFFFIVWYCFFFFFFFFQAEDGIRDLYVTGVQTCALPICLEEHAVRRPHRLVVEGDPEDLPVRPGEAELDGVERHLGPGLQALDVEKRSEEHTSELQSRRDLVCRLLLEKKNYNTDTYHSHS